MHWRPRKSTELTSVTAIADSKRYTFLVLPTHVDGTEVIECRSAASIETTGKRFPNAYALTVNCHPDDIHQRRVFRNLGVFNRLVRLSLRSNSAKRTEASGEECCATSSIPKTIQHLDLIGDGTSMQLPPGFMKSLFRRGLHLVQTISETDVDWLNETGVAGAFATIMFLHNTDGAADVIKRAVESHAATTTVVSRHMPYLPRTSLTARGWHIWKGLYHHRITPLHPIVDLRLEEDISTSRAFLCSRGFYAIRPHPLRSLGFCAVKHSFADTLIRECIHHLCNGQTNTALETCVITCHEEETAPLIVGAMLRYLVKSKRTGFSVSLILRASSAIQRKAIIECVERLFNSFGTPNTSDSDRMAHHNMRIAAMSRAATRKTHGTISDTGLRHYTTFLSSLLVPSESNLMPMVIFKCKYAETSYVWTSELNSLFNVDCPATHIATAAAFARQAYDSAQCTFKCVKNKSLLNISIQ